jgi:O-antigen/teichoic acid export membrane protein
VQLGIQKGFIAALWQIFGSLLGAMLLLVVVWLKGSLPWIVAAVLGAPLLAACVNTVIFFWWNRPDLQPRFALISRSQVIWIARLGGMFFVLQLVAALAFGSDNVIAARIVGAAAVGDFAIAASLFGICATGLSAILQPLWPAYSEAIGRRDFAWVWSTLVRSTVFATCAAALFSLAMLTLFRFLTTLWLHRTLNVPSVLLMGLALWAVIQTMGTSLSMFLNGAHVVRLQMMLSAPFATLCIGLKIVFVSKFGVAGLPWAAILSYVPISLMPVLIVTRRLVLNLQKPAIFPLEVKNDGSS